MTACNELEKTVPIIVLGASGYAGQLVTRELKARNLEFVVADIDSHKLETLVQELGGGIQWEKIDILDAPALEKYCEKGRVLINCAGPYSFLGEPVINAVIKAKTHCIDFSEESKYLIDVRNRHDEIKQQGITIINGVGMGGALGDIAAAMAGAGFESVESVDIAYAFQSVQFSRGTLSSILSVL